MRAEMRAFPNRLWRSCLDPKAKKLGWIGLRGWYAVPGDICNATVSRRAGQWHVAVQWEREIEAPVASTLPAVGIDMGIAVSLD
jgi:putative transposase